MRKLIQLLGRLLFWLAIVGIVVIALSQLLGHYVWQFELFTHYVPHLAVLILLAVAIFPDKHFLFTNSKSSSRILLRIILAAIGISLAIWSLHPFSIILNAFTPNIRLDSNIPTPTTIAYQNVNINNLATNETLQQLVNPASHSSSFPDVVALVEAGGLNWNDRLNKLAKQYHTHCGINENSPFAMQVFTNINASCDIIMLSGFPVARLKISSTTSTGLTSTVSSQASPDSLDKQKILYVAHPPPPLGRNLAILRNQYFAQLAKLIKSDQHHSVMVIGDFNLSAFSPVYRDFMSQSKGTNNYLRRTTLTGLPTWRPFGLGIDHVLVNSNEEAVNTKAIDWQGSDHRGFIIKWQ